MKYKIEKSPIIISGCARSGTSIVAGIIDMSGSFGGQLIGPSKYNRKGQFENRYIRDQIEKPYLRKHNLDPLGQNPIAKTGDLQIPELWKNQVEDTILREGYTGGSWYYKGAKACQIWPVWHYAFPNAKWVIVRRRNADIAQSCLDTSFMHKYKTFEGWIEWTRIHEVKFVEMIQAGLKVKQIWPERLVNENYEQLYEIIEWLGLTWDADKIMEFVDRKLWKAKQKLGLKK